MLCVHVFINNRPLSRGMLFRTTYSYPPTFFYTIFSRIFDHNIFALLVSERNGFLVILEDSSEDRPRLVVIFVI